MITGNMHLAYTYTYTVHIYIYINITSAKVCTPLAVRSTLVQCFGCSRTNQTLQRKWLRLKYIAKGMDINTKKRDSWSWWFIHLIEYVGRWRMNQRIPWRSKLYIIVFLFCVLWWVLEDPCCRISSESLFRHAAPPEPLFEKLARSLYIYILLCVCILMYIHILCTMHHEEDFNYSAFS